MKKEGVSKSHYVLHRHTLRNQVSTIITPMSDDQDLPQLEDELIDPASPDEDEAKVDEHIDSQDSEDSAEEVEEISSEAEETDSSTKSETPKSNLPAFLREIPTLALIGTGLLLSLSLLIATALLMDPALTSIPITFDASANVLKSGAPNNLYNLAIVGLFAWIITTPLGIWLHWRHDAKFLAYIVWLSAIVTAVLLWIAAGRLLF